MGKTENINIGDQRLGALIDAYLTRRSRAGTASNSQAHLDEDTLAAFVEGNLTLREADPLVAHIADCSFCRHKTSELICLDLAFAEMDAVPEIKPQTEVSRVSDVVSGILSRLFGTGESAVFAHEEKTEEKDDDPESEKKNSEG